MALTSVSEKESRRIPRISMSLPIKVELRMDPKNTYEEISRLRDVSKFGTGIVLSRPVKRGRLLFMTIPMPRKLRNFDFAEPQYRIWGIVRNCIKINDASHETEKYAIGVAFIGKNPPPSFYDEPSKLYDIAHRSQDGLWRITEVQAAAALDEEIFQHDRRRHTRFKIPADIIIEELDQNGTTVATEQTVTENISLSGAAVFSSLQPDVGSFVRIRSEQYRVSIISIVRGRRLGTDGIPRLHVEFIDRFFPLEGIE